jgi:hypothetical protein
MSEPPVSIQASDIYYITMFHQAIIEYGEHLDNAREGGVSPQGKGESIELIYKEKMKRVPKDVFMRGLTKHLASENETKD